MPIRMSHPENNVLLIENNPGDAALIQRALKNVSVGTFHIEWVTNLSDGLTRLSKGGLDAVLTDLSLPDSQGMEALDSLLTVASRVPILVLSDLDEEQISCQSIQHGAQDYLPKSHLDSYTLSRSLRNMIDRKAAEDALFTEKERAQVTLNSIEDAVLCTNSSGNVTYLNTVAERMTGWSREEASGRPLADVFRIIEGITRESNLNPLDITIAQNNTVGSAANCILIRRDGQESAIEDSSASIHDPDGHSAGAVIVFHPTSTARSMSLQMAHSAQHDFLTGLPNRLLLNDRISQAIALAQRYMNKLAVLFLDFDGFKHVNDSLGHAVGDKLLQSVAIRLVDCIRGSDTVSRQGGDEFVVLLCGLAQPEDVISTVNRILMTLVAPHSVDLHDLHVTTSIGVSIYPDDGLNAETLIKNADTAMYQAKENGCHGYRFFKAAMNVRAVERQSIEESLRHGLERQEFMLHYQPIINLSTGEITGAEGLLRWTHPIRGAVSPADFIPVAEDCGLIVPIGNWVLREACKQARTWIDGGLPPITMSVNISAIEVRDEQFLRNIFAALKDTGLNPRFLELELTESVLMNRVESTQSILKVLRETGVRLAIDDFGTGYSSLSYLSKFPISALKIDQSFVRQIDITPEEKTIVGAIISMGRSLNLRVIAEGVETLEELAFLHSHHCDEAQGYYIGRPMAAAQFSKLLETGIPLFSKSAVFGKQSSLQLNDHHHSGGMRHR